MYKWVDSDGQVISTHSTLESAGRHHRRMCRIDVRCIGRNGQDMTDAAIISSIDW